MAIISNIIQFIRNEDGSEETTAPILTRFPYFLEALADFLDYEHYLAETQSWEPAFSHWENASAQAQEDMFRLQREMLAEAPRLPVEKPLKLIVFGLSLAMLDESGAQRDRFRDLVRCRGNELLIKEKRPGDRHVNDLLKRTLILFDQFLDLYSVDQTAPDTATASH
ncbi:hypothetical protein [Thioclava sp. IC9]|uniref:hypothetical protein n=1 Tax=Thioclava sp. IC9 TaxID=1973007 RepID=UPI000B54251A|nr:hypothetical protein [Thioclava sp. IC9]OWX97986.1 hypothetical protein B6V76_19070 [Thioclava sp. IC9]